MTKYTIYTDNFEFHGNYPALTKDDIIDLYNAQTWLDPHPVAEFTDEAEARAAFAARYRDYGTTRHTSGWSVRHMIVGQLAYLEVAEWTDDGDFISGGDWLDCSVEPYQPEEENEEEEDDNDDA